MPVVGVALKEIEADRKLSQIGPVKVNNKVSVTNVLEKEFPEVKQKGIEINFKFLSVYDDQGKVVAEIKINGSVFYSGSDANEILKSWEKEKVIPDDPHIEIINTVFRKCVSKAIMLAEDIQLPPPIGLPFAQKQQKE